MAAIIFDMDGTIADSFDFVADFLADRAGKYPLSDAQRDELRGYSMAGIARRLGLPWWRMLGLFYGGRKHMRRNMHVVRPFEGMPELIRKIHNEGHELFLVSSNSSRNVRTFLKHYHLLEYFLRVYGGIGFFSKGPVLRKLVKEQNLEMKDCIYVGDEVRDVQASQSVNMRIAAVDWGFATHKHLHDLKPTKLVSTRDDLMGYLETI